MELSRSTYIGAVTAITYSPDGSGASVSIYDAKQYKLIVSIHILQNASIHGIRFGNDLLVVFGQKEFSVFNWNKMVELKFKNTAPLYAKYDFVDWIWDMCLLDATAATLDEIALGTAHNTVVMWSTKEECPTHYYYGKERCILYSLSFFYHHGELLVASGTVFTEVHIWSPTHPSDTLICRAHKGVIFKLRWSQDGRYLLSVSDDRVLIAWRSSLSDEPWTVCLSPSIDSLLHSTYYPLFRAYGHTSRLWDCIFTPSCLITTSEDCSIRLWDNTGSCITAMGGHKGKHIWCVGYDEQSSVAVTGGNDGSIKLWDIDTLITTYQSSSSIIITIPSMTSCISTDARTSKSECIRDLLITHDGISLIIASNWGYVWKYHIQSTLWEDLRIPVEHESVSAITVSTDNTILAQGDFRGNVTITSLANQFTPIIVQPSSLRVARLIVIGKGASMWLFIIYADNCTYMYSLSTKGRLNHLTHVIIDSKGTISSVLYFEDKATLCIGDSMGTIHLYRFSISTEIGQISVKCMKMIKKTHGHQPIGCLVCKDDVLWTAGHDGKILPISVNWIDLTYIIEASICVPVIKQIISIWWTDQDELCVSGYREVNYIVYDITNNCQIVSIPAGGWKRPLSQYHHPLHPSHGLIAAFATPSGHSDVSIFCRVKNNTRTIPPALFPPTHGRELNAIRWIMMTENGGILVTGGEDRLVQLVEISCVSGQFTWRVLRSLDGHSSTIRALYSLPLPDNRGYLLISCGGRNEICIWELYPSLSQYRLINRLPSRDHMNRDDEADQRIMCVNARMVTINIIIIAIGDSCGVIRVISMEIGIPGIVPILSVASHSTPILSIAFDEKCRIIAGTAAGDILYIDTSSVIHDSYTSNHTTEHTQINLSSNVVQIDQSVHTMGVNSLILHTMTSSVECISVGDDQSIRINKYSLLNGFQCVYREVHEGISGTALRGITSLSCGVFVTGWEQKVQRWVKGEKGYEKVGEINVLVPETAAIDMIERDGVVYGAVCGAMGCEVFELSI